MPNRTYGYFCLNEHILAIINIRYKLGFYIYLTVLNDYISQNEYII